MIDASGYSVVEYFVSQSVASEVQPAVFLILAFTWILGLVCSKYAWLWALIIGASILGAHGIARGAGYQPPYPVQPNIFATLIAIIPAFLGSYFGVFTNWALHRLHH